MRYLTITATNITRGAILASSGRYADTSIKRIVGLLLDTHLDDGDGLWIKPCNSIHSFFMRFDFDALYLDKNGKVVRAISHIKPWRIMPLIFKASSVLELPAGTIDKTCTAEGDVITFSITSK